MITKHHRYFHWIYHHQKERHWFIIGSGLFSWFFLSLTLPFGIYDHNFSQYLYLVLHLSQYGAVWMLVNYSVDAVAKIHTGENVRLDIFLWLLKIIFHIHAFLLLRGFNCQWLCIDLYEYLELWVAGFLLFFLFYIPFMLYGKYKYFHLMVSPKKEADTAFTLKGGGKDAIAIKLEKILYFKADDNYVDILFISEEDPLLRKTTLRATLTSLSHQLVNHPQFQRVHRSYMVNLNYLGQQKSKRALILSYQNEKMEIPISRSYQNRLHQIIAAPLHSPQSS